MSRASYWLLNNCFLQPRPDFLGGRGGVNYDVTLTGITDQLPSKVVSEC